MTEREQAQQHAARLEAIADQISGVNVRRELRYAATFLRALADRPEPAQPVAPIWHRTIENDLEQERLHREQIAAMRYVDIVFDGPPSHKSGRFVEVEDASGKSIKFGEWVHRPDGFWVLRIAAPPSHPAPSEAAPERQGAPILGFEQWAEENGFNPADEKAWSTWKALLYSRFAAQPAKGEGK